MDSDISRGQRVRTFWRLFAGIAFDFWREARLTRRIGIRKARERMSGRHRKRASAFREAAVRMGGVLIKLGQFLSARADIMPEEYLQELSQLQDTVPPVAFDKIRDLIEEDFGRPLADVFASFDENAIAAASLAEVHRATLPGGEEVAVKVQRPGVAQLIDTDMATLSYLMEGIHRFTGWGRGIDLPGIVDEFARTVGEELDFYREGWHAERFRANFQDSDIIYIPGVHWDYTTDRVLTLESIEGYKISDYEALEKAGIDRKEVAREVAQSMLQQVLDDGFFHADPHPGNLFVLPGPEITFVDFGMVGEISPEARQRFKDVVLGVGRRDIASAVDNLAALGFIRPGASKEPIRNALSWVIDNYSGVDFSEVDFADLEHLQEDIRTMVYEHPFNLPAEFAFLGRAFGTSIGLVIGLDPDFDFMGAAQPFVERMRKAAAADLPEMIMNEAKSLGALLLHLPRQVQEVLVRAEKGDLRVRTDNSDVVRAIDRAAQTRVALGYAILAGVCVAVAATLNLGGLQNEAGLAVAAAAVFGVGFLWKGRARKRGPSR